MQVSYVINSLATGGAERMLLRQLQYSSRKPTVYILGGPKDLKPEFVEAGASIVDVGSLEDGYLRAVWTLRDHLSAEKPDIVHSHLPNAHIVARPACMLAKIEDVVSTHHNVAQSPAYQSRVGALEKVTRTIDTTEIAVSDAVGRSQKSSTGLTSWEVIHNAIDVEAYHNKVAESDGIQFDSHSPVFLNVGRYVKQKGQETLIKAMPDVVEAYPNAAAVIVGWGSLEAKLKELTREVGVSDNVFVTGKVPAVSDYYSEADIFVMPSLWEGLPIVLLEAMAAGLPVVGTDTIAIPEIVTEDFAKVVSPQSPEQLAEKMISVADGDTEVLGENAFRQARKHFDITRLVEQHETLYERIYYDS